MDFVTLAPSRKPDEPDDPKYMERARAELEVQGEPPETLAKNLDAWTKAHVAHTRRHLLAMGPILYMVRTLQLYRYHPENFGSFREWLAQPEISLHESLVTDIINWWRFGIPACERAGIPAEYIAENIDQTKIRLLVAPIKRAEEGGEPLPNEEIQALVHQAEVGTCRDLQRMLAPSKGSLDDPQPKLFEDEDPLITFRVVKSNGHYTVSASLTETEMFWIEKRVRPVWVNSQGEVLKFGD